MGIGQEKQGLISLLDRMEAENSSKGQIEFGMHTYLDMKAREKGVPLRGTFELTPLCNLDCKMCYVHLTKEQLAASERTLLTGDQWKQIMKQAIDRGLMFALLTGGEAMLHPDFEDIFMFLRSNGVHVSVTSNGLMLTEKRISFFEKHKPSEIRVTLYGADNDTYENVTGHRVFECIIDNIKRVKDAGIPISIGITPSKYIQDDIEEVVKVVRALGIKYGINSSLSDPRKETGRNGEEHDMPLEKYILLYKRIHELDGDTLMPLCEEDIPKPFGSKRENHKGFRCGGGRSSFAVVWHGSMQPCLSIDEKQFDLKRLSFDQAWGKVFQFVSEYPVPQECFGCPYEGFCTVCVARHSSGAPLGHANPLLCDRAKRFAREGLVKIVNTDLDRGE